jgi:RecG-like helicase
VLQPRFARTAARLKELQYFPTRANAVHMIHFPEELTDVEIARQRLALDEFVELQFGKSSRAGKNSRPRERRCRAAATTG